MQKIKTQKLAAFALQIKQIHFMLIFWAISCTAVSTDDSADTGNTDDIAEAQFAIRWQTNAIDIDISFGNAGIWWFGIAETTGENPWTGEDCFEGDWLENGDLALWCHPLSLQGGELQYGGSQSALNIGQETALSLESAQKNPMYYFINIVDGYCAIGGSNSLLYADLCDNAVQIAVEVPRQ